MWQSIKEYTSLLRQSLWVVALNILGAVGAYLDVSNTAGFPLAVWLALLFVGLVVSPFLAFHRVRVERDQGKKKLEQIWGKQEDLKYMGELLKEGKKLFDRRKMDNVQYEDWKMEVESWYGKVCNELAIRFTQADVVFFTTTTGSIDQDWDNASGWEHNRLLCELDKRLANLHGFIGRQSPWGI